MSDDNVLIEKAREAIQSGRLPRRPPVRMWGGPGVGHHCPICREPVTAEQIEYELEFPRDEFDPDGGSEHVHLRCYDAWEVVRNSLDPGRASPPAGSIERDGVKHPAEFVVGSPPSPRQAA
jgi:hypothetical protein|nr:MAG: hypothetical protein DIU56_12370 [Pseudomonadota bacterium]